MYLDITMASTATFFTLVVAGTRYICVSVRAFLRLFDCMCSCVRVYVCEKARALLNKYI